MGRYASHLLFALFALCAASAIWLKQPISHSSVGAMGSALAIAYGAYKVYASLFNDVVFIGAARFSLRDDIFRRAGVRLLGCFVTALAIASL
jgi:hypothetical protein